MLDIARDILNTQPILAIFLAIGLGYLVGQINLGGFSLGARTTVEGVGEGLRPRRAILGGAGLEGLRHWERRKHFFLLKRKDVQRNQHETTRWGDLQRLAHGGQTPVLMPFPGVTSL